MHRATIIGLILSLMMSPVVGAQDLAGLPSVTHVAEKLVPGTVVNVRLHSGSRIRGTIVSVSSDELTINPGARTGPLLQHVPLRDIASIERGRPPMTTRKK